MWSGNTPSRGLHPVPCVNATEWELCVLTGIPPGGRPDDLLPDQWLTASAMA